MLFLFIFVSDNKCAKGEKQMSDQIKDTIRGAAENARNTRKRCFLDHFGLSNGYEKVTLADIASRVGVDVEVVRKIVAQLRIPYMAPWPYNLLNDILGYEFTDNLTKDQERGIEAVVSKLSPREKEMVTSYYKEDALLSELGDTYGVTKERVRQIIAKALRKLRYPANLHYILYGFDWTEKQAKKRMAINIPRISRAVEEFKLDCPIEELDFSVRAYNCLKRSKLNTVGDVVDYIQKHGVTEIRNCGKKTQAEVLSVINSVVEVVK